MAAAATTAAPPAGPRHGPVWQAAKPFVSGGLSAILATCCVQPIDMVKVRLQLAEKGGPKMGPFAVAANIIRNEGVRTFYSGLSAAVFRQITYGTTRLGVFSTLEKEFALTDGTLPWERKIGASLLAGGIGALVGTPAEVALVRMQADTLLPADSAKRRGYKHVGDALFRIAREEGIRGFFSGASPTVYRGLAVNVGMLATYASFKEWTEPYVSNPRGVHVVAGLLSGWAASTLSLPFDLIKTRLQRMSKDPVTGQYPYKGFLDCAVKSVQSEGPLVLYRGYATYVFRISPHIALTWLFLEGFKSLDVFK